MLEVFSDIELEKLIGWRGLKLHAGGYYSRGERISIKNVGSLSAVSSVEAYPSTRLVELWFEQQIIESMFSVRVGQLAPDLEFMIAENGRRFVNSTFLWPTMAWDNIPVHFASPGIRFLVQPSSTFGLHAGVMNGDPVGPCTGEYDPAQCNPHGINFRIGDPAFTYAEASYAYGSEILGQAGTIKLGGWYHFGKFTDKQRDDNGKTVGRSDTGPHLHAGNHGFHAVIEQKLFEGQSDQKIGDIDLFARIATSPSNRNQIDFQVDAGLLITGLLPARSRDVLGVAIAYSRTGSPTSAIDEGTERSRLRGYETVLEISYDIRLLPGVSVQPDLQYIWHPGGHLNDEAGVPVPENSLVLGVRTALEF